MDNSRYIRGFERGVPAGLFLLGILSAAPAGAVKGTLLTAVTSINVTSDGAWGGCMVAVAHDIRTAANAPDCPGRWVSFSCDGTHAPQDMAFQLLDVAKLALALKKQVVLTVDDSMKLNGYCVAVRVQSMP